MSREKARKDYNDGVIAAKNDFERGIRLMIGNDNDNNFNRGYNHKYESLAEDNRVYLWFVDELARLDASDE